MGEEEFVESTSDDRTVNNVMRHQYKVLSDEEKKAMQEIKDRGLDFYNFLESLQHQPEAYGDENILLIQSNELLMAKTKIEEAVMWAVKHITR